MAIMVSTTGVPSARRSAPGSDTVSERTASGRAARGEQRDHGAIGVADQMGTVAWQLGDTVAARIRRSMTASL